MVNRSEPTPRSALAAPPDDLCLGFVNTLYWRGCAPPTETLAGPDDLLAWAEASGGVGPAVAAACRAAWADRPDAAAQAFSAAIELRETIYRLFAAVAGQEARQAADLAGLNGALEAAPARSRLRRMGEGFGWELNTPPAERWPAAGQTSVALLLAPVLWSAGDLLGGPRRSRVRRCANDRCLWLFLDDSKSGNRRWCSMSACGNRAKAHRHYLKHRR